MQEGELAGTKPCGLVKWQPRVGLPQVHLWEQPRLRCPEGSLVQGKSGGGEWEHAGHR